MKLQIVEYNRGQIIGCSQDTVWFIQAKNHIGDKWKIMYWDNDYKMPCECEAYISCGAYYTLALAENAFNKIVEYKSSLSFNKIFGIFSLFLQILLTQ